MSLRAHPLAFLRESLQDRGYLPAPRFAIHRTDGEFAAGPVLVRQMPGSAKGVMFITLEDEAGTGNLIVWPSVFEEPADDPQRLDAWLPWQGPACGGVIHLIVEHVSDLTADLKTVSGLDTPFPLVAAAIKPGTAAVDRTSPKASLQSPSHGTSMSLMCKSIR